MEKNRVESKVLLIVGTLSGVLASGIFLVFYFSINMFKGAFESFDADISNLTSTVIDLNGLFLGLSFAGILCPAYVLLSKKLNAIYLSSVLLVLSFVCVPVVLMAMYYPIYRLGQG